MKAQGLSLNVIIVAALGLIVLVLLIVIFSGKMGDFSSGTESATSIATSGFCVINSNRACVGEGSPPAGYKYTKAEFDSNQAFQYMDCKNPKNCVEKY